MHTELPFENKIMSDEEVKAEINDIYSGIELSIKDVIELLKMYKKIDGRAEGAIRSFKNHIKRIKVRKDTDVIDRDTAESIRQLRIYFDEIRRITAYHLNMLKKH